jgi:hypothetical protein
VQGERDNRGWFRKRLPHAHAIVDKRSSATPTGFVRLKIAVSLLRFCRRLRSARLGASAMARSWCCCREGTMNHTTANHGTQLSCRSESFTRKPLTPTCAFDAHTLKQLHFARARSSAHAVAPPKQPFRTLNTAICIHTFKRAFQRSAVTNLCTT